MKATASELARNTAHLLSAAQHGKKVEIIKHGKTVATLTSVRTISGQQLLRGMARLSAQDKRDLKAAIAEGMKGIAD